MTELVKESQDKTTHDSSEYLESFRHRSMDWNAVKSFAAKNLRIAMRYPANFLVWGILPILWFAPFILMATAIAGPETSAHFTEISGFDNYIQFVVIGWFVFMYLENSIWAIGNNFRWEQMSGTLEPLFSTPVPRISILLGAAISDTIQGTMQACVLLSVCTVMFGLEYSLVAILPTIIILTLMVIALYGFSFMLAGLILVFKDPSVLTQMITEMTFMVSPINYPVQALPKSAQFASYLVPTTIGIITIREIAINGVVDLLSFSQTLAGLGILAVCFWILGISVFKYAEKWTKQRGHMGGF